LIQKFDMPQLRVKLKDIRRATAPVGSGNEGWIGISPLGDRYHIVVPVDVQIARGVMACNCPTDGTPFGGYSQWLYFRCRPYEPDEDPDDAARETAGTLVAEIARYGIIMEPDESGDAPSTVEAIAPEGEEVISCGGCGAKMDKLTHVLAESTMVAYNVCPDDFSKGRFVFMHMCGGAIEVPVTRFVRPPRGRSFIGSHACPGYCRYAASLKRCAAECEGAVYRRIAARLWDSAKKTAPATAPRPLDEQGLSVRG
jgi:hypothetical protein